LVKIRVLTRGPQATEIERGVDEARFSWAEMAHGLGRLDQKGRSRQPGSRFGILEIKINKLRVRGKFRV
jgi:hypothetical protein